MLQARRFKIEQITGTYSGWTPIPAPTADSPADGYRFDMSRIPLDGMHHPRFVEILEEEV